jgi:hypothetical protein
MIRIGALVTLVLVLALATESAIAEPSSLVTPSQLAQRFRQATGDKLVVNKGMSDAGRYQALDYGPPSIQKKGKYGTFTVYVVTAAEVEDVVKILLMDLHTGKLGTPGPGNIYWESGTTMYGDKYWTAKRRYGDNVVLEWSTESKARKTDSTWKRLHTAFTKATR